MSAPRELQGAGGELPGTRCLLQPTDLPLQARDKQSLLPSTAGGRRGPAAALCRAGSNARGWATAARGAGRRGEGKGRGEGEARPVPPALPCRLSSCGLCRDMAAPLCSARPAGTALTAAAGPASSGRPRQAGPGRARCCSRQELGGNGAVPERNKSPQLPGKPCLCLCLCVYVHVPAAGAQGVGLGPSAGPVWRMKERGGWSSALPAATRTDFIKR